MEDVPANHSSLSEDMCPSLPHSSDKLWALYSKCHSRLSPQIYEHFISEINFESTFEAFFTSTKPQASFEHQLLTSLTPVNSTSATCWNHQKSTKIHNKQSITNIHQNFPMFFHVPLEDPFPSCCTRTITSNSALLGKAQEEHRRQFRKLRRYLTYFQVVESPKPPWLVDYWLIVGLSNL